MGGGIVGGLLHPQDIPGKGSVGPLCPGVPQMYLGPFHGTLRLSPEQVARDPFEGQHPGLGVLLCPFSPTCLLNLYLLLGGILASVMTHASPLQGLQRQFPALQVQSQAF